MRPEEPVHGVLSEAPAHVVSVQPYLREELRVGPREPWSLPRPTMQSPDKAKDWMGLVLTPNTVKKVISDGIDHCHIGKPDG